MANTQAKMTALDKEAIAYMLDGVQPYDCWLETSQWPMSVGSYSLRYGSVGQGGIKSGAVIASGSTWAKLMADFNESLSFTTFRSNRRLIVMYGIVKRAKDTRMSNRDIIVNGQLR
jgi:hypothetical protein